MGSWVDMGSSQIRVRWWRSEEESGGRVRIRIRGLSFWEEMAREGGSKNRRGITPQIRKDLFLLFNAGDIEAVYLGIRNPIKKGGGEREKPMI